MASGALKRIPRWGWAAGGAAALLWLFGREQRSSVLVPSLTRARKPPPDIASVLQTAAREHGVPVNILTAVAYVESRYNPAAQNPAGPAGLMQLMKRTADALGVQNRFDALDNARGGAKFLAKLKKQFGDWQTAIAAYNWGPGRVKQNRSPESWRPQTQTYVANVLFAKDRV